jgi:hypothetical protein
MYINMYIHTYNACSSAHIGCNECRVFYMCKYSLMMYLTRFNCVHECGLCRHGLPFSVCLFIQRFSSSIHRNVSRPPACVSHMEPIHGCQIFLGTKYQNGGKYTKLPRTIPNVHKIQQKTAKWTKCP